MSVGSRWLASMLFGRSTSEIHRECRHCGTTVADDAETCPSCGASEIAAYRLPE